ncbi:hypothetical protein LACWKB8_0781 [Lactobacillus sp. wkB8]|uniref:hypothetical protein n=1 Tax=Lactobacillus sp. wkB8 TaxID=1545702 RepID=UPI00050D2399|nr:hypothetical protein [Lactobacillus sp. wkB8]AIS09052.1 hypothetical protein LACWKB8_0781 [Lactobacillus sp. wkB8]
MKKFKKILTVAATGMIALSLVGCSDNSKSGGSKPKSSQKVKKTNTQKTSFRNHTTKLKLVMSRNKVTVAAPLKMLKAFWVSLSRFHLLQLKVLR